MTMLEKIIFDPQGTPDPQAPPLASERERSGRVLDSRPSVRGFEPHGVTALWSLTITKLEDLKVLGRSPDLFNYVKIGQGQLQFMIKHILFYHIWGLQPFWSSDLKQSNKCPVISEKPMFT